MFTSAVYVELEQTFFRQPTSEGAPLEDAPLRDCVGLRLNLERGGAQHDALAPAVVAALQGLSLHSFVVYARKIGIKNSTLIERNALRLLIWPDPPLRIRWPTQG